VLAGGTAALALRLAADALAGVLVFAGACQVLRLDEYLYLKDLLRRAILRGRGLVSVGLSNRAR
jgi:putative peptidoglycan lipid II flippase